jgi:hypothetical protein
MTTLIDPDVVAISDRIDPDVRAHGPDEIEPDVEADRTKSMQMLGPRSDDLKPDAHNFASPDEMRCPQFCSFLQIARVKKERKENEERKM